MLTFILILGKLIIIDLILSGVSPSTSPLLLQPPPSSHIKLSSMSLLCQYVPFNNVYMFMSICYNSQYKLDVACCCAAFVVRERHLRDQFVHNILAVWQYCCDNVCMTLIHSLIIRLFTAAAVALLLCSHAVVMSHVLLSSSQSGLISYAHRPHMYRTHVPRYCYLTR